MGPKPWAGQCGFRWIFTGITDQKCNTYEGKSDGGGGGGVWELEGRHSDCPSPVQELSPPHSPEGQTQLHPVVGTQSHLSGVVLPRPSPPTQLPGLDSV